MDYFSEDSAPRYQWLFAQRTCCEHSRRQNHSQAWAKAVLAFYACLFLAGATAIGVYQSMTTSGGMEQHATLRTDVRSTH